MAFDKITDADLKDRGVVGLPDIPELSTAEMQAKFDELAKTVIIPKLNKLIDDLSASTASGNIGVTVPEGFTAIENIQSLLDEIAEIAIKSKEVNTLLTNIASVSNTVSDDGTALATCKAVFDYVIQMGGGDMTKAVYDTNNDGVVDDSSKLGGKSASAYLEKASVVDSADGASAVTETGIPVGCKAFAELMAKLGGCWISFTDAKGNPTTEPYIHWYADDGTEVTN